MGDKKKKKKSGCTFRGEGKRHRRNRISAEKTGIKAPRKEEDKNFLGGWENGPNGQTAIPMKGMGRKTLNSMSNKEEKKTVEGGGIAKPKIKRPEKST